MRRTTGVSFDHRVVLDWMFIVAGVAVHLLLPFSWGGGDGATRFSVLSELLKTGDIQPMPYSIVGPLFATPFWLADQFFSSSEWWVTRFNFVLFVGGLVALWSLLRSRMDRSILRAFLLLLVFGSMFPRHVHAFYGEVFTAVLVAIGILLVQSGRKSGWFAVLLGSLNTPATAVGYGLTVLRTSIASRRWKYLLLIVAWIMLICSINLIQRGSVWDTGYVGNQGLTRELIPYSGAVGFGFPFFIGLMSILFSFGKGLIFYVPGLFLPVRSLLQREHDVIRETYVHWVLFAAGLVLVYSKWWAWHGDIFWGPRFFLVASFPACMALALHLRRGSGRIVADSLALIALVLSCWVGLNGLVFNRSHVPACGADGYALELLCWYVPEYSALWNPFVFPVPLATMDLVLIALWSAACLYLAIPLAVRIMRSMIAAMPSRMLKLREWRF